MLRTLLTVAAVCGTVVVVDGEWIYPAAAGSLDEARRIGREAKLAYVNKVVGVQDTRARNNLYLDGLEECNEIDREWTNRVEQEAISRGRVSDASWLERAGMKPFTALFMTFPPKDMFSVAQAACTKHEKQLTCGAEYEGEETTRKRINDLMEIGNHRIMFEKECRDKDYVTRVYPCIGKNVDAWIHDCKDIVNSYSVMRDSVNSRVENLYDKAVASVKKINNDDHPSAVRIFDKAMTSIVRLEGHKCGLFKEARVCVLRRLLAQCGPEATRSFNTSISLGYLRTERRERLHLDFQVFDYPPHPNCHGL